MNIFDIQSQTSYYNSQTNQRFRKRTYKLERLYKVYSFQRANSKFKPSSSLCEKIQVIPDDKALNQSCQCYDCGGKIKKRLLRKQVKNHIHKFIKVKYLELNQSSKNLEGSILRSSKNPSIHTPINTSKGRTKFKPINHLLQMVHVKSMLSKLANSQPIQQLSQKFLQLNPQTVSENTQKIQVQEISEQKDIQSPLIGQRLKTEPNIVQQNQRFSIDTKKFYYPRISRIISIGAPSPLLNQSQRIEKKPINKPVPLTSRHKSPSRYTSPYINKRRALSQKIQCPYQKKSEYKLKDLLKRRN
ncbi:unnamed protein product [Paramecium sonneborni]|uniref:Uncharacterized protein n=1 Tax=Paramecium sonneborni TaxID=65129 RepID=A0A8S1LHY3_9CILI|nr:unnamed protein product [Paramecium sonneborni]